MDSRNVRVLMVDSENKEAENTIFVDSAALFALHKSVGDEVIILGRRKTTATLAGLKEEDSGACVARLSEDVAKRAMLTIGDEAMLYNEL